MCDCNRDWQMIESEDAIQTFERQTASASVVAVMSTSTSVTYQTTVSSVATETEEAALSSIPIQVQSNLAASSSTIELTIACDEPCINVPRLSLRPWDYTATTIETEFLFALKRASLRTFIDLTTADTPQTPKLPAFSDSELDEHRSMLISTCVCLCL